jgi:hypothetical protein
LPHTDGVTRGRLQSGPLSPRTAVYHECDTRALEAMKSVRGMVDDLCGIVCGDNSTFRGVKSYHLPLSLRWAEARNGLVATAGDGRDLRSLCWRAKAARSASSTLGELSTALCPTSGSDVGSRLTSISHPLLRFAPRPSAVTPSLSTSSMNQSGPNLELNSPKGGETGVTRKVASFRVHGQLNCGMPEEDAKKPCAVIS